MSTRPTNCLILVCDGCGKDYEHEWIPHYDTLGDAREESINAGEWRTDGKDADWCPKCQEDTSHTFVKDAEEPDVCARCAVLADVHDADPAPAVWPRRTHDGQRMRDTDTADVAGEVL